MKMNPFSRLLIILGSLLAVVTGRVSWSCPPWLNYLRQKGRSNPTLFWGTTIGVFCLIGGILYGYHWYQRLPHPHLPTAHINAPDVTPLAEKLIPNELSLDFGIENATFTNQSVAPLGLIGKKVTKGITMTPAMPGQWVWQSDSHLVFTPEKDWPAGQSYQIHFDKSAFAPGIKMKSLDYSFSTKPFEANITEFKFYQNPENAKLHQVVATIEFNYPVDSNSLKDKTLLHLQALQKDPFGFNANSYKFTINYDEHKRIAYLHSDPLPLPKHERYLELKLEKGIKPLEGPSKTSAPIIKTVLVPDAENYFKVSNSNASIIRNEQDRPEQVLTIETTVGVTDAELNKSLHVYLLPQDYPATSLEEAKKNYTWQNPGEVTDDILKLSTPVDLKAIPADRDFATLHSYKFSEASQTPRYLFIKLDKGITSFGDYVLANDFDTVIKVPDYPKEIGFLHKGALLALSSEKKLSVVVRGLPAVKFEMARVLPDNVNQLITQTRGNFNNPQFINDCFNQQNISEIFSEVRPFDKTELAKEQYTALDLGKYLSAKTNHEGPLGLFLLQATGWDNEREMALDVKTKRLILITDLGLIVKDNRDGTHELFVQSITKGEPVANAKVTILGKNGLALLSRTTDVKGHATFPSLVDFIDEQEPTVYLATLGNDVSFIPYNNGDRQLNYSKFDVGGRYSDQELQSLTAYVFSDRGIYRPGDTIHVAMIVKQMFVQPQLAGLPVEATVTDPRGTVIKNQRFTVDETGYLSFDFATEAESPTGEYTVNLFIVKDNHPSNILGSTTIRVAEFLPDRMRIVSHLSQENTKGWISPVGLTGSVGLWNLYGAPAADRKIEAKIILTPQRIQFKEYPDYIFMDPLFDPKKPPKVFTDTLTETTTNDKGEAEFNLNLERFDKATYQLTFFAEGFEAESGRSVTTQKVALVSPLTYFIGYKPDGDLNYIKQNGQRSVDLIAVNSQLKRQAVPNLKIQLLSLHPVTTLVKNPDGTYQYQSIIQTTVVNTQSFSIGEQGTHYALPAQQIGDFAVAILDQNNVELSRFKYSIVGQSQLPLSKNAELSVKLNKSEYQTDEDIELQITAPYTGTGLITIERDKVYAVQWFKTDTTSSIQKIHIPKEFQGNGYVNVAFVRDWNSPEIFISPLSYNVVPFSVNHNQHAIHIDLTTPSLARPGEPFTIQYKSDKPGKIIVFAVDEGILQVGKYPTPDPLDFFFSKYALEVITQQTVDQILPKFIAERELSAVGGDGSEAKLAALTLNPFKRKTDLPVVFWSGIVDVDTTPRVLTYQIPTYFNGTLRVMAVAVNADAVGAATKTAEVRGYFVINPNVPTVVAPGDEFEITASVANNVENSGSQSPITVQLTATPEIEIIGSSSQIVTIAEGHEKTVRFKCRARANLGSAGLTLTANNGDKLSKMVSTLSVRPASSFSTSITSGTTKAASLSLPIDRVLYPEYRTVEAAVSTSPLILVTGLQRYLEKYPYGCTEQLVSEALPVLALGNQPWFVKDRNAVTHQIQTTIQMLAQRQMSSGAISYWPGVGDNASNPFASVYAMHFLTEARRQGYDVPNDLLHAGISYLRDLAKETPTSLEQARIQAYAIYVLTRNEIVTTNYLTNLQIYLNKDPKHEWRRDITSAYLAATYQLLKSYNEADRLIHYYHPETSLDETIDFYSHAIANAQYLYLLAVHFPDQLSQLDDSLLDSMVTAMNSDSINTLLSGYASLALNAYTQSYQAPMTGNFTITEIFPDHKQKELSGLDNTYVKVSIDPLAEKIKLNNPNKVRYFYQLIQAGFDKKPPKQSVKEGLEIAREYRDLEGNVITKTSLGNEIKVHIQVRALKNPYLSHIAIIDLIPGGFEVVRDSINLENLNSQNIDYADVREDRVVFFGNVSEDAKEMVYRIKAINTGKYVIPPAFANSMYNPNIRASSVADSFVVE